MKPTTGTATTLKFLCAAFAVLLLAPAARAAEPVFAFEGKPGDLNRGLPANETFYHPSDEFAYGEVWHFMAKLDQGYTIYCNLLITNMGLSQPSSAVEFSILGSDGKSYTSKREYDKDSIAASTTAYSVRVGASSMGGAYPHYQVHLDQDGMKVDLAFENILPGWKLGNGVVYFGADRKKYWKYAITSPSARVTGTLRFAGKQLAVTGFGFQDHSLMNIPAPSFSRRWFHFRSFNDKNTVLFSEIQTSEEYTPGKISMIMIGEGNRIVAQGNSLDLAFSRPLSDPEYGYAYPGAIAVKGSGPGLTITGEITSKRLLERVVVLSHLNTMIRSIVHAFIAKPVYYRCLNDYRLTVNYGGADHQLAGEAVNETVFIK